MADVVVIGAGIGGLAAAISLAAQGLSVSVYEAAEGPGGKAGIAVAEGVTVDTGPSVLTLPDVFDRLFRRAGTSLADEVSLRRLDPGFRYLFPDGVSLDVFHDPEHTVDSVRDTLGPDAAADLEAFLDYARRIWEAAAPRFVFDRAPTPANVLWRAPRMLGALTAIDPLRTMESAIRARVRSPHLRDVLRRYATYNGSDPRSAPATLNCIAWVELGLGGWGVRGGMYALVTALERVALRLGVAVHYGVPVSRVRVDGAVRGVVAGDTEVSAKAVVCNAGVAHLFHDLLPRDAVRTGPNDARPPSMSGWTAVARAQRRHRVPHTVLFPDRPYLDEFADIFDRARVPADPTVYLCAQEPAHGRAGWYADEPVFLMANAPPEPAAGSDPGEWEALRERVLARLVAHGLLDPDDRVVWERTPAGLAERFPRSRGSLYGAASNGRMSAFARPPNRWAGVPGLYLASGSAHPGGGLPLVAQSGLHTADLVARDLEAS